MLGLNYKPRTGFITHPSRQWTEGWEQFRPSCVCSWPLRRGCSRRWRPERHHGHDLQPGAERRRLKLEGALASDTCAVSETRQPVEKANWESAGAAHRVFEPRFDQDSPARGSVKRPHKAPEASSGEFFNSCSWSFRPRARDENGRPSVAVAPIGSQAEAIFRPGRGVTGTGSADRRVGGRGRCL